jgi:3-phenylpropionate/trans-cinnamate dioxygenase ferredoxin reductase component
MQAEIAIIGAGETGARAALALRRLGFKGALALVGADAREPYELPPLSKQFITEPEIATRTIASRSDFAAADIHFLPDCEALAIDRAERSIALSNGHRLGYGKLLLATGCAPRPLAIPGVAPDAICTLRSADDALALRARFVPEARIVIIGGGFIGLELAASAAKNGASVTLIEGLDRILKRGVPAEVAEIVAARHRQEGVAILTGRAIVSGERVQGAHRLTLSDETTLTADCIVAGIGATPRIALAEAAGLAIENGIRVDGGFQTSDPAIFAAGDCASYPHPVYGGRRIRTESWRAAVEHAAHVARAMLGEAVAYDTVPWFWSDQYDLTLQVAGLVDEGEAQIRRDLGAEAFILCHLHADGRIVAASGIGPGDAIARDVRLAEMLIQRGARPDPARLADASVSLKSLLKG